MKLHDCGDNNKFRPFQQCFEQSWGSSILAKYVWQVCLIHLIHLSSDVFYDGRRMWIYSAMFLKNANQFDLFLKYYWSSVQDARVISFLYFSLCACAYICVFSLLKLQHFRFSHFLIKSITSLQKYITLAGIFFLYSNSSQQNMNT